jgi:L-histidine Nalpha-methyltransferase
MQRFMRTCRDDGDAQFIRQELYRQLQTATVSGHSFDFDAGETIHTKRSRKYGAAGFSALANANGWQVERIWSDEHNYFNIFGLS